MNDDTLMLRALQLRAAGSTYKEIGEALDMSLANARRLVMLGRRYLLLTPEDEWADREVLHLTWRDFDAAVRSMARRVRQETILRDRVAIFGLQAHGSFLATALSSHMGLPLLATPPHAVTPKHALLSNGERGVESLILIDAVFDQECTIDRMGDLLSKLGLWVDPYVWIMQLKATPDDLRGLGIRARTRYIREAPPNQRIIFPWMKIPK